MSTQTSVAYNVVCGALVRAPKRAPKRVGSVPVELSEAGLLAAWTAADAQMRALTAELERRDTLDAFAREGSYVSVSASRHNIDAEYTSYLEAEYNAAAHACKAYMVSASGQRRGFKGSDFFKVGRRPSVEKWGSDELRAWFGSGNAVQSDTRGSGHVLSKTEYAAATREEVAA
jgi:hypothetical protein